MRNRLADQSNWHADYNRPIRPDQTLFAAGRGKLRTDGGGALDPPAQPMYEELLRSVPQVADKARVKRVLTALDPDSDRRLLKGVIVFDVLLAELPT